MRWFWRLIVAPMLEALRPSVIVEIGAETGVVTAQLAEWSSNHRALLHVIDPEPQFDVEALKANHRGSLRIHRTLSLRALPRIQAADLILIDGDHNWYTVRRELRQLEHRAAKDERLPPVILLHDIGWPYARRDLYYFPGTIPSRYRHRYEQAPVSPARSELGSPGLNPHLYNAVHEGGPANGVLTAVEDFVSGSETRWHFTTVPGMFGLGILAPEALLRRRRKVRTLIASIQSVEFMRRQCEIIERARVEAEIRAKNAATSERSTRQTEALLERDIALL